MPLPLRGEERRGPWAQIGLFVHGPRAGGASGPPGIDGVVLADPAVGDPGSVREHARSSGFEAGPRVFRASPPAWPGAAPDIAPGAPAGDAAAFGQAREDVLLAACYAGALAAAEAAGVRRLAFASLGVAHPDAPFPAERAGKIALGHAAGHFARRPPPTHPASVVFLVTEEEAAVYRHLIDTRTQWAAGRRRA